MSNASHPPSVLCVNGGVGQHEGEMGFYGLSEVVAMCSSKSLILSSETSVTM